MPTDPTIDDGQPFQALDANLRQQRGDGYSVISGCDVTVNTGDLGKGNNTLTVGAGQLLVGGTAVDVVSQSVDIPASDSSPRKDLVVYDEASAAIDVYTGTPEPAEPRGASGVDAIRPAPPDVAGGGATVLKEVWVAGGASSVGSGDLTKRRVFADGTFAVLDVVDDLGIPIYSADSDAPTETLFYHSGAGQLRYKDGTGTVAPFLRADGDTMSGDLDLGGNRVTSINSLRGNDDSFSLFTSGSGAGLVGAYDSANNQYVLEANEGGVVNAPVGPLQEAGNDVLTVADTIDADTLDTYEGADLAARAENETISGAWTYSGRPNFTSGYAESGRERIVDGTWSESGVTQASYTLSQSYDKVILDIDNITGSSTALEYLQMGLNGSTTANYDWIVASGTRTTGDSSIRCGRFDPSAQSGGGTPEIEGRWGGSVSIFGPMGVGSGNNDLVSAKNDSLTSPLSSIQLQFANGSISIDATVYGVGL